MYGRHERGKKMKKRFKKKVLLSLMTAAVTCVSAMGMVNAEETNSTEEAKGVDGSLLGFCALDTGNAFVVFGSLFQE